MSLKKKVVQGAFWTLIGNWGRQLIASLIFLLLVRLLKPEAFGLVASANIFLRFTNIFLDQGLSKAIIQRQDLDEKHLDAAFWTNIGFGIGLTLFSLSVSGWYANFFHQPDLQPIIQWLSLSFLINSLSQVQTAILARQFRFKERTIKELIAVIAGGIVGIIMAINGYNVWSLVGQQLTSGITSVVVLWTVSDWRPSLSFSVKHFQELFAFSSFSLGIDFIRFININADDFLIGYYLGTTALGYYSVAYRMLLILSNVLLSVINSIGLPSFSRLQEKPKEMQEAIYSSIELLSLISFPMYLGVSVITPDFVPVFFGQQWLPSIPVMQILTLIGIHRTVSSLNGIVLMAMGKPAWELMLLSANSVVNVIVFYLVVNYGIVAVASAYVIRAYIFALPQLWIVKKLTSIDLKIYFRKLSTPLISSVIMFISIMLLQKGLSEMFNSQIMLILSIGVGAIIYCSLIMILAPTMLGRIWNLAYSSIKK